MGFMNFELLDQVLSDAYCVRCDSTIGHHEEQPDFCQICWERRERLPSKIRLLLEQLSASEASRRERS